MVSSVMSSEAQDLVLEHRRRAAYLHVAGTAEAPIHPVSMVVNWAEMHPNKVLIVDLRPLENLSPQWAEWLEQLSGLAETKGLRIRIVTPRDSRPRRMLQLLRFDRFLVLCGSAMEAFRFGSPKRRTPR